jgi:hypothetical protein
LGFFLCGVVATLDELRGFLVVEGGEFFDVGVHDQVGACHAANFGFGDHQRYRAAQHGKRALNFFCGGR